MKTEEKKEKEYNKKLLTQRYVIFFFFCKILVRIFFFFLKRTLQIHHNTLPAERLLLLFRSQFYVESSSSYQATGPKHSPRKLAVMDINGSFFSFISLASVIIEHARTLAITSSFTV